MRTLILGGTGFCGSHLARLSLEQDEDVYLTGRSKAHWIASPFKYLELDILKPQNIADVLVKSRPDKIYHLAGFSSVGQSFKFEEEVYKTNVLGTFHVLKAIKKHCPRARVLVAGSSEEYGPATLEQLPISEEKVPQPISPYGVSKVASSLMSLRESSRFAQDGLNLVVTRTFNLTGPGQQATYVCSDFARQIAKATLAGQEELTLVTGNIEVKRDFSSVEDGMRAYRELIEKGESGHIYNVCSGEGILISRIVQMLAEISGLKVQTRIDPGRLRSSEVLEVRGDPAKLKEKTGFCPGSLKSALKGLFDWWMTELSRNTPRSV
jgi:GDP-4-dehydro-6-deoxy-D-mannose reductase